MPPSFCILFQVKSGEGTFNSNIQIVLSVCSLFQCELDNIHDDFAEQQHMDVCTLLACPTIACNNICTFCECSYGSTAVSMAVNGHNTDSVHHIVGHSSNHDACPTGGEGANIRTDSDDVTDWSPTIILWGLPLHCEGHTVPTILLNSRGGSSRRRGETYREGTALVIR